VEKLPAGTVTLLFADIEGSTWLVQQLGEEYAGVLERVRQVLRAAVGEAGGHEIDCRADELFAAFASARAGVGAAVAAQRVLASAPWPSGARVQVRMGLHTGEPVLRGATYVGVDVNLAARVCAAAHGGQILATETTRDVLGSGGVAFRDLGEHALSGLSGRARLFQVEAPGLESRFPAPRSAAHAPRRFSLRSRRARQPTLEELGWQVRALMPATPEPMQRPLGELAAALFGAGRALAAGDGLLARVDARGLERRREAERKMAVSSASAARRRDSLEVQIACLERVAERRDNLAGLTGAVAQALREPPSHALVAAVERQVVGVTADLDAAVAQATAALDPLGLRLTRTRHRGVYRSGTAWVVPFVDTVGAERRREFPTRDEARSFAADVRMARKGEQLARRPEHDSGGPSAPGGGGF
jgi:class 3 adenylate cyclase